MTGHLQQKSTYNRHLAFLEETSTMQIINVYNMWVFKSVDMELQHKQVWDFVIDFQIQVARGSFWLHKCCFDVLLFLAGRAG